MFVIAKGKKQQQVRQLKCQEQVIDHIPHYLLGLSRAQFFTQPFSKQLYIQDLFTVLIFKIFFFLLWPPFHVKKKLLDRILIKSSADLNNHLVFQEQLRARKVSFQLAYLYLDTARRIIYFDSNFNCTCCICKVNRFQTAI